jgi:hypothetical protein
MAAPGGFDARAPLGYASGMRCSFLLVLLAAAGCSEASDAAYGSAAPVATVSSILPSGDEPFVTFVDETTGFMTSEVFDADREIISFDPARSTMVFQATGEAVTGWSVTDGDLDWTRSGVPFRVRFGTEEDSRRAYFTERGPGTICNLSLSGPDTLGISATSERPPNP